jgi:predicted Zn-dependent peptidase
MREYHEYTFPNGLRVIHEPSPTNVVYCGYIVYAGTRNEELADSGMAHFCEHMTFKGTDRRKSWHVRNCLEHVGGDLNAYTDKEMTAYYATVQKEDFPRAVDLLSDIVFHSTYQQREIEKEVEVIVDEIDSYNDSPAELIYDEFEEMLFRGHSLGRNILGKADRLREYTTQDAFRFVNNYYVPNNVTMFILGQVDFDKAVRLISKHTKDLVAKPGLVKPQQPLPEYVAEERVCDRNTHQAHVLIGNRGCSRTDKDQKALFLLSNILGGPGMNSLLNVSLREKHGLVYSVSSYMYSYQDSGIWSVYFGCDESKVEKCKRLVLNELSALCDKPMSPHRLSMAKKQFVGQILISGDSFENYALAMGRHYARTGKHRNVEELCNQIRAITADDLQRVAQRIFRQNQLTTLVYK